MQRPVPANALTKQLLDLREGDHLCLAYEKDPVEQMVALIPLIHQGLKANEQFLYIADDQTEEKLARQLDASGIDVAKETAAGRLKFLTRAEWRRPGQLDSRAKAFQVGRFIEQARAAGFGGIRFAVEMTWTLGPDIDPQHLEHWEATINTLFSPAFPTRIICLYNRSRLSSEAILAALRTHPIAILGAQICPNIFYQAPLLLNGDGHGNRDKNGKISANAKADWMITQLMVAREAQHEHSESIRRQTVLAEAERARAEEALRLSEERFRLAAHADGLTFYEQDTNLRYIWLYPEHPQHEGALGRTDEEILSGEGEALMSLKREVLASGVAQRRDVQVRLRDGLHFYDLFVSPRRTAAGELIGVAGVALDITENRRAENASRHLAAIVEFSEDAIVSKDINGVITSWNKGAERMFGYTAAEVIGKPVTILIPADRQSEEQNILKRIRDGQCIEHYETIRQRKNGSLIEISLTVSPIKDRHGTIIGASKAARDITERKRIERQQQALFELVSTVNRAGALPEIYAAALDAICRCHGAERASILLYDDQKVMRFKAWRGLSEGYRKSVEGHSPWTPDDPDPQVVSMNNIAEANLDPQLRAVIEAEGIQALAFIPIVPQGKLLGKFMIYFKSPQEFTADEFRSAQTIASQIAFALHRQKSGQALEQLVAERTASLREAIAQMEEFSYSVSHDLRAPVRAMQGYATAVLEDCGEQLDAPGKEYLDRIVRSGTRMDRLIQDILIYSRLSRREIQLHPVSLARLAREIIQQYPEMQPSRAEIEFLEPMHDVLGHEASLSQALSNLLSNAVKFVPPGTIPRVRLGTEVIGSQVRFFVQDQGIGIKPEHQHRLFGLFERIHPAAKYDGTGIGLAIVRKAIERMGGKVGVESDGIHGSRFWFELPAAAERK